MWQSFSTPKVNSVRWVMKLIAHLQHYCMTDRPRGHAFFNWFMGSSMFQTIFSVTLWNIKVFKHQRVTKSIIGCPKTHILCDWSGSTHYERPLTLNTGGPLNWFFALFLPSQLKDFIQMSSGGTVSAFTRALEIVKANVKWHNLYKEQFFQWLRKSPND